MQLLRVSSKSPPASVAGALTASLKQDGAVELQSVGAAALNQAVKAICITRGFLAPEGKDVACVPAFSDIEIDGEVRTAIRTLVVLRDTGRS